MYRSCESQAILACMQPATRNSLGTTRHIFEDPPAPNETSSALFGNSTSLASVSCGSVPMDTGRIAERAGVLERDPRNRAIPTPRLAGKFSTWNPPSHAERTYHQNCMVELPRNQFSKLHVDKFPDTSGFQCWKTNFRTEVCSCSGHPTHAMLWIKEKEVAK